MRNPSLYPICLAFLLATSACGDDAARKKTIPVGYVGQFSNAQRTAYLAAIAADLNESGGIDLPDGHYELELAPEDHGGTTAGGVAAMHRLADKGVTVSIDPNWSSIILGDKPDHSDGAGIAARDLGIVVISGGATAPAITDLDDGGYVFRTVPSDVVQGAVAADTLTKQGITTAAILYRDDPYGSGLSGTFRTAFEASGGQVVGMVSYPTENTDQYDYASELATIFQNKPQAVMFVTFDEAYTIATQIDAGGYLSAYAGKPPTFFGTDGFYDRTNILQNMPVAILEHLQGTVPHADRKAADYLKVVDIAAAHGIGQDNVDTERYDALVLLALGIQAAGTPKGSAVKNVLGDISRSDPGDVDVHPGEWAWDPLESTCRHASLSIL